MSRKDQTAKGGDDDRPRRQPDDAACVPPARTRLGAANACWPAIVCGLLLAAVALVFGKTLLYEFVNYDDDVFVYENPMVARGLTAQGVAWACTANVGSMAYPLTWFSYLLDSQAYGLHAWGFHLTNVLLHGATTLILFLTLRRMTGNLWAAAFVALLFAIHPLQVESVAWVGERKGPLSGFFFVSAIAAYVAYARHPFSLARYLAVAGLFVLAMLAKPNVVMLPFVLLLLDYWPLGRWQGAGSKEQGAGSNEQGEIGKEAKQVEQFVSIGRLVVEKIPLVVLGVAGSVAAVISQAGNVAPLESMPIPGRIANALTSYAAYLGQFFWPVGLAVFYPRTENLPAWLMAGAFLALSVVSVAALVLWRKQPAVLVGWLWYLGTLLPMSGLVPIGEHARADRYTYLPQIGLSIAAVWAMRWGVQRLCGDWPARRWLYGIGGTLLAAGLMACAWQQTSYWQSSDRLWKRALACTSNNHVACNNLGNVLARRGHFDEAVVQYRKALEAKPKYAEAHYNLGVALARLGQLDEAIVEYRKTLEIKPDHVEACNNLGDALAARGNLDEAIAQYRKALDIKPDHAEAHYNLGAVLARRGHLDEAIDHYHKALESKPDFAEAHTNLANLLARRGHFDEAIDHYRRALETKPDYAEAHYNLGNALASRGQVNEALDHYQKALGLASAHDQKRLADIVQARIRRLQAAATQKGGLTPSTKGLSE